MLGSAVFAHVTADCPRTLQWAPLSPKIATSHGVTWTLSNIWFPRSIPAHNPSGISIGLSVLAGLISVTDTPTDR